MASAISQFITQIQNAVYGEQVRSAIVGALEACYSDVENPDLQSAAFLVAINTAYESGILDIIKVTRVNQMTNENIIYRYMGTETGYTANTLYFHNGTAWIPIGSGVRTASTVSLMTDTSAIYKYTGNESGYEANTLYYHNGTAWTPISSKIETDKSLSQINVPADGLAVGNALDILREDVAVDDTFSYEGQGADAKATGEELAVLKQYINEFEPYIDKMKEEIAAQTASFDVSSLPDYWEDMVFDALVHVSALGDGYVHNIITTDNHYDKNYGKSGAIQKLLYDTGLFSKVINLGDVTDSLSGIQSGEPSPTEVENVLNDYSYFGNDLIFCIGNHDDYNSENSELLPLIEDNEDFVGDVQHFNYYYDDSENKIRYVVVNTGWKYSSTATALANLATAVERVASTPAGYHCVLLSHYPLYQFITNYYGDDRWSNSALVNDKGLLGAVMSAGVNFVGVFCGHAHDESCVNEYGTNIHQTVLLNDGNSQNAQPYPKTEGTTTENVITIMSINKEKHVVKLYRVGRYSKYGQRWQYNYKTNMVARILQGVYLKGDGIRSADNSYYCVFPVFSTDKPLYLVNNGSDEPYWEYRYNYLNGVFVSNQEASIIQPIFAKKKIMTLPLAGTDVADHCMIGFRTRGTIGSADDFEIITNPNRFDMGYSLADVPWYANKSWNSNNYNGVVPVDASGYKASDLISVDGGRTYHFAVDNASFSAAGLIIHARGADGYKISTLVTSQKDAYFTTPARCKYITISAGDTLSVSDIVLE